MATSGLRRKGKQGGLPAEMAPMGSLFPTPPARCYQID